MHDHERLAPIGLADLRDGGGHDRRSVDRNIAAEIPVELEFQLFFDRQRMEAPVRSRTASTLSSGTPWPLR